MAHRRRDLGALLTVGQAPAHYPAAPAAACTRWLAVAGRVPQPVLLGRVTAGRVAVAGRVGGPDTVARVMEIVMLDLEYWHVDVFSRRALRGNGLVVVLNAASLPATVMQDVTREVRQFETAFVTDVDLAAGSARLRIFTEDEELDFAGHPVLGGMRTAVSLAGPSSAGAGRPGTPARLRETSGIAGWHGWRVTGMRTQPVPLCLSASAAPLRSRRTPSKSG
jgi:hypothetical protein